MSASKNFFFLKIGIVLSLCFSNFTLAESNMSEVKKNCGAPEIKMDSRIVRRVLPNGFEIAVMKNAEPPKRVSMRLLLRRGSSTEKSGQEGIAHFTEHMAFNGTKHFPKGDMVEYFQRLGMAFGADTNAHTSFNETVYKIDMPDNTPKMIDDGLKLLSDYAGGMLFPEDEIERERGVIIAEKKARDNARYRGFVDFFSHIFKGTPYENRMPIGLDEVIKNANRETFLDFYKSNYRPENMTLVVVGDIDENAVMAEAKKYFENLKADENTASSLPNFSDAENADVYSVFADADLNESGAGVYLVAKPLHKADCLEKRVLDIQMAAISCAMDLRFNSKKSSSNAKFISAYAYFSDFENYRDMFSIEASANVGKSGDALAEVLNMYEGAVKNGFGDWEIQKAKSDILNTLESAAKSMGTKNSASVSNKLVSAFSDGEIPTSPELDFEIAKFALKDFDAQKAEELFESFRKRSVLFVRASDAEKSSLPRDFDAFLSSLKKENNFYSPLSGAELVFDNFGKKGEIVSEKNDILGIKEIAFKNGVRANLKVTDFTKDEVVINVAFGAGRYDIPKENPKLLYALNAFILGGTKYQSYDLINVAKSDKNINIVLVAEDDCFMLKCRTNTKHLREALALVATYINAPAFSDDALNVIKKKIDETYRMLETNPDAVEALKLEDWLYAQNHMFKFPSKEEMQSISMREIKEWLLPILKNSYMEVSIAGDFDEKSAEGWLSDYLGSMPERAQSRPDYSAFRNLKFTDEREKTFEVASVKDARSTAIKIWRTCGRGDLKKMRAATILGAVLNDSIRKNVREKEGKVYSPFAYNLSKQGFDSGLLFAETDVAPEYNGDVVSLMEKSAKDVSENITEDEFERAKLPVLKQIEKTRRTNSYWADRAMPLFQSDKLRRETAATFESGYSDVSLDDVKKAASEFLKGRTGYTVKIIPQKRD